jgi:hypothetical protein
MDWASAFFGAVVALGVVLFAAGIWYLRVGSQHETDLLNTVSTEDRHPKAIYERLIQSLSRHPVIVTIVLLIILIVPFLVMIVLPAVLAPSSAEVPFSTRATARATIGLAVATAVLAGFTFLLVSVAIRSAIYARDQIDAAMEDIRVAMREQSADFTFRLHDDLHSDRVLRIRHGAVMFLQQERSKDPRSKDYTSELDWTCDDTISPHWDQAEDGLNADLVEVLNILDRIAYLTCEAKVVNEKMAMDRFGSKVQYYYEACEPQINALRAEEKGTWQDLRTFYISYRRKWCKILRVSAQRRTPKEINQFLRVEHVRSHRGSGI